MPTKLTIAICLFALTLVIKLVVDYHLWLSGKPNKHKLGPALVLIVLIACSWLSGWKSIPMWAFGWWALMDSGMALLMGEKIYYVGTTAKLDQWQRTSPALLWLKYFMVPVTIILFIKL